MSIPGKIDVHHHVYPPVYTQALQRNGGDPSGWFIPPWTLEADRAICAKTGIATAILSCTAPGPGIEKDPAAAAKLARDCNTFCAALRDTEPEKYGFFASLPNLTDTAHALSELAYALDTLHADGVILLTSYTNPAPSQQTQSPPLYLGHASFRPIWEALSARNAVVFIHPTHAAGSTQLSPLLPQPAFDYPHETGRTAIDLITSRTLSTVAAGCGIILSHAGGTLPYLIDRVAGLMPFAPEGMNCGLSGEEILGLARRFWYDTALSSSPMCLRALGALLGEEGKRRVLFGSDFPNAPGESIGYFTKGLERGGVVDVDALRGNAVGLFPRLG